MEDNDDRSVVVLLEGIWTYYRKVHRAHDLLFKRYMDEHVLVNLSSMNKVTRKVIDNLLQRGYIIICDGDKKYFAVADIHETYIKLPNKKEATMFKLRRT